MSRLEKLLIKSVLFSALTADLVFCPLAYAQSNEARELNRKGVIALDTGHHAEAVQLLKKAMALEPKWGEPCFNAARLLRLLGKRDEMLKMLKRANSVEPNNATYAEEYLRVLNEDLTRAQHESNLSEAKRIENEIFRVNPGNLRVGLKKVNDYLKTGDKEEALLLAQSVIDKNSRLTTKYDNKEMGELLLVVAQVNYELGDFGKAKAAADSAVNFDFYNRNEARIIQKKVNEQFENLLNDYISKAKNAQKSGNLDKAVALLREAEKIAPNNENIQNLILEYTDSADVSKYLEEAVKHDRANRWLDAREVLVMLEERYPGNPQVTSMLKKYHDKEQKLMDILGVADFPTTAERRKSLMLDNIKLGKSFWNSNNLKGSLPFFNKALALIEEDRELRSYKSEIEDYINKYNNIEKNKDNWRKAVDARNAGDYDEVISLLNQLPQDHDIQYYSYLAEAYYKKGDEEKASEYALKQLSKQNDNNRAKFILGSIYLENNELGRAHIYFSEIYASDPEYPEVYDKLLRSKAKDMPFYIGVVILAILGWIAYILKKNLPVYDKNSKISKGRAYFKNEDYDNCINTLQGVRHSPHLTPADNFEITKLMAQSYLKKGTYDRAIGECKQLITIAPNNEEAHSWLGYAYLGRRVLGPDALPELLNLYKKDSRNFALVSFLGSYYAQQKNLNEEGVGILEQWLNLDHDNVEVLKPLGKYYLKKNRSDDKAMKVFQKMMEIGTPDPDFLLGVANVHLKLKQFDTCLQLCEKVINDDMNNEYVHTILLEVYKKQDRLGELLEIYSNFLKSNPYNVAFQNALNVAQAAYSKQQSRMANTVSAQNQVGQVPDDSYASADNNVQSTGSNGQITCPACGKGNPSNAYCCQHCGANMYQ